MPEIYRVEISEEARRDLIEIDDYIFNDSPQNAAAVADELESAVDSLNFLPYRFKVFENNADPARVVRSMPIPPFIVFYRINETAKVVEVLTVRHGARDRPPRFFD